MGSSSGTEQWQRIARRVRVPLGFVTAAVFIIMDRFSTIFSTKGNLPPGIAAWIPNMVFVFVAIYIYRKAPK